MNLLTKLLWSVAVFVVAWLVIWLVAMILVAIPTEPTVWLGNLIDKIAVLLALLVAVAHFAGFANWSLRR